MANMSEKDCNAELKPVRTFRASSSPKVQCLSPKQQDWLKDFCQDSSRHRHLDIGSGAGMWAIQCAKKHPEWRILAIERTKEKYRAFQSAVQRELKAQPTTQSDMLTGLLAVFADAVPFCTQMIKPSSIDSCSILYPNPYPKESQSNKRFHRMPFFHLLLDLLKPGATLEMATNEGWLAQEMQSYLSGYWRLELLASHTLDDRCLRERPARTHFEKKYLERGMTCHNLLYKKPAG